MWSDGEWAWLEELPLHGIQNPKLIILQGALAIFLQISN